MFVPTGPTGLGTSAVRILRRPSATTVDRADTGLMGSEPRPFHFPFPARINPAFDAARRLELLWIRSLSILSPEQLVHYDAGIKKIKRQLYGWAGFELLHKMILLQQLLAPVHSVAGRHRSEFGRPDPDRVLTRAQPQLRLGTLMPLLCLFFPVKAVIRVGPRDLQHGEGRPPVEPGGLSEEGPVPAQINLPERDLVTVTNVRMSLAFSQYSARGGLLSEPVEHAVHAVDIESEHGEFRCAVSV